MNLPAEGWQFFFGILGPIWSISLVTSMDLSCKNCLFKGLVPSLINVFDRKLFSGNMVFTNKTFVFFRLKIYNFYYYFGNDHTVQKYVKFE